MLCRLMFVLRRPMALRVPFSTATRHLVQGRFHTHTRLRPRPQLHLRGPGQILWSYFTAPSNLLFISTNVLGFTIAASWRGLSTLSSRELATEEKDQETLHSDEKKSLMGMDGQPKSGITVSNYKSSILKSLNFNVPEDGQETQDRPKTEGMFISEDIELPWCEQDLSQHGPSMARDVKSERIQSMVVEQLLSLYYAHDQLVSMFHHGVDVDRFQALHLAEKEELIKTLLNLIDTQDRAISNFEDFLDRVPSEELHSQISSISPKMVLENLHESKERPIILYEQLETMPRLYQRHSAPSQLIPLLSHFQTVREFSPQFLLSSVSAVLNTDFRTVPYGALFKCLETEPDNENYQIFGNVLGMAMLKHSFIFSESHLIYIIRSAISAENKSLFDACLHRLRLGDDESSPRTLIYKITKGKDRCLSITPYLELLKGLVQLDHPENVVMKIVGKILSGLRVAPDGEQVIIGISSGDAKQTWANKKALDKNLPLELLVAVMNIGIAFDNQPILKWCLESLEKKSERNEIDQEVLNNIHLKLRELGIEVMTDENA